MVMIVCGCLESSDHLSEEEDSEVDQLHCQAEM